MGKIKYAIATAIVLSSFSGLTFAQSGPGVFYTNLGATIISDGSDSESAYFGEAGYSYYFNNFLAADFSYRHTQTFNSSVSADSEGFSSKYDSYSLGIKVEQAMGGFNLYGTAGASYIPSETTRWDTVNDAPKTVSEDSIEPYISAGIKFSVPGSPLLLDVAVNHQLLPNSESATSVSGGVYLMF